MAGVVLLFAPEEILPHLIAGYPPSAGWFGQLFGTALLAMADLNWLSRFTVLGGIYGRPIVSANLTLYFVSAVVLFMAAGRTASVRSVWLLFGVTAVLALAYAVLMFRGPLAADRRVP
jgi:hypothetical protein